MDDQTAGQAAFEHRFPQVADACRELASSRVFATRIDIASIVDGTTYTATFGAMPDARPDPMYELHCLTKPLVAWTLLEVASRHGLDPLAPLRTALGPAVAFDDEVTIAGICNHTTRLALPSGLDWIATTPARRPTIADLRQEREGAWYSEVGAWVVAAEVIRALEQRPATEVVADLIARCDADAVIGTPLPPSRPIIAPLLGLPDDPVPMLHVLHPTYQQRLGPAFGGFGSVSGYVRFLREVGRCLRSQASALQVDPAIRDAVADGRPLGFDETWKRPAAFRFAMVDGPSPGEADQPSCLTMYAGVASATCLLDRDRDRQLAFASDGASLDASDHQFVRGRVLGAFLSDTGSEPS